MTAIDWGIFVTAWMIASVLVSVAFCRISGDGQ